MSWNAGIPTCSIAALCAIVLVIQGALSADDDVQNAAPSTNTISLPECIRLALRDNLRLAGAMCEPEIAGHNLRSAQAEFDPRLTVDGSAAQSRSSSAASALEGSETPTSESQHLGVGIKKRTRQGTTVSLTTSLGRSATDSSYATLNPVFDSTSAVGLSHPLLKGGGSRVNLAGILAGEIDLFVAGLVLRGVLMDTILATELAFRDLMFAMDEKRVRSTSLKLAQDLLKEARALKNAGVTTPLQVLQAEAGVATRHESIIIADQRISDTRDQLLALMGQVDNVGMQDIIPVKMLEGPLSIPDASEALECARRQQPEYRQAVAAIEKCRISLAVARNRRLPNLDVNAGAGVAGKEDNGGDAWSSSADSEGYRWQVGLALSVPWGFREERANLRKAEIRLKQAKLALAKLDQDLNVQVRSACRAVSAGVERIVATAASLKLSERRHERETAKFNAGLSISRDVLDAQEDVEEARMRNLKAQADARKAMGQLSRIKGAIAPGSDARP